MRRTLHHQNWRDLGHIVRSRKGMSLVEVMVVIAIILTLMGILTWGIFTIFSDSQVDTTKLQMTRVAERVSIYSIRKKLPTGSDGLSTVFPDGVPQDSWGNDFVFVTPGPNGADFDLISYGADGQDGGTGNNEDIKYSAIH